MIIILISLIIFIIGVIIFICIDIGYDLCKFSFTGFIIGVLIFGIGTYFISPHIEKEETVNTRNIYALNDASSIKGQFFLMSGSINEEYTLRYIINTPKGRQVKEIKENNIYIKEGNYKPHLEYHDIRFKNEKWYLLFSNPNENYTIFYVPENSIISDYNIDLE